MMEKASVLEIIKSNIAAFLLGWIIGGGLMPMLYQSLQF